MSLVDEVYEKYGGNHYGRYVAIICPYHDDTSPSMLVYEDGFRCEACGKRGKTETLLEKRDTFLPEFPTKKVIFRNPFTSWSYRFDLPTLIHFAWENLPCYYLEKRGIPPKQQSIFYLGYLEDWITFPIFDRKGIIIGATARAGEDNISRAKYVNPAGQNPNLLYVPNWSIIKDHFCLTFGILDALTLAMIGIPAASTTTGKRLDPTILNWYRGQITIIPDKGEEAEGYWLANKLGLRARVHFPDYTEDKDINGLWQRRKFPIKEWKEKILKWKG